MRNLFRLFLLLLLSFVVLHCIDNKSSENPKKAQTFTLNAHLEGLEVPYLIYFEKDDSYLDGYRRDTLWVKDQKFSFTDSIDSYKIYFIDVLKTRSWKTKYGDKEYTSSTKADVNRLWFIGYPGANITCTGTLNDYMVNAKLSDDQGVNNDLTAIHSKTFPIIDKVHELSVRSSMGQFNDEEAKVLRDSMKLLYTKTVALKKEFISSYPQSIAAAYIFNDAYYRKYFDENEAQQIFKNLDSLKLAGVSFYEEVKNRFAAFESTKLGMQAPEIATKNTLDGSEFKLSDLKGNYVLFDYWGLWCGPCMAEIPKIKEYANKYEDKNFVVVGINSGDTAVKWKKAIEENNYNWTHIQTTKDNDLLIPFNVSSFPTKILVDPNGKIIYNSSNPEKVDMYQIIDNIFKKS